MSTYFEEVQRLRDRPWILVPILAVALSATLPLYYGLYWQVGHGQPWGDKPMSDAGIVFMTVFVSASVILLGFVLLTLRLEVKIDAAGIHYRMYPVKQRWRTVSLDQIEKYELKRRYNLFESAGIGHHRNVIQRSRSFKMWGGKHLRLTLTNGETLMLGTTDLTGLDWAMRKLTNKNATV